MKIDKAAVKKARCTSVKGSEKSLDNILKRLVLSFSFSDKKLILKFQIFLFHDRKIVSERPIEWKHIVLFPPISHNQQILYG